MILAVFNYGLGQIVISNLKNVEPEIACDAVTLIPDELFTLWMSAWDGEDRLLLAAGQLD